MCVDVPKHALQPSGAPAKSCIPGPAALVPRSALGQGGAGSSRMSLPGPWTASCRAGSGCARVCGGVSNQATCRVWPQHDAPGRLDPDLTRRTLATGCAYIDATSAGLTCFPLLCHAAAARAAPAIRAPHRACPYCQPWPSAGGFASRAGCVARCSKSVHAI